MSADDDKALVSKFERLYYDPNEPTSYTSQIAKKPGGREYLSKQLAHTLHKPRKHRFKRRKILVSNSWTIFSADLADLKNLAVNNGGYRYILVVIDIFSRMAFVRALKEKTASVMIVALRDIFLNDCPKTPNFLWTDRGSEFVGREVKKMLKSEFNMEQYSTSQSPKAAMAERLIRTLKERIFRYLTANVTEKYVDVLPKIASAYNNSPHSSLGGLTPVQASQEQYAGDVYHLQYPIEQEKPKHVLNVGDVVRLEREIEAFEKSHYVNWSDMFFTVATVHNTSPLMYSIKDPEGKTLPGRFYFEQLQKLPGKPEIYRIDRVLRRKGNRILVKWMNHPSRFNSWESVKSLYKAPAKKK